MKKKLSIIITVIFLLIMGTLVVFAASSPGSEEDPIVTKSYVDNQISGISKSISDMNESFSDLKDAISSNGSSNVSAGDNSVVSQFSVVTVEAGKKLLGGEGTQIILRSGRATAISIKSNGIENGISDLTSGSDLLSGEAVLKNHLILVPRADGRGITAQNKIYVMVCGAYTIR